MTTLKRDILVRFLGIRITCIGAFLAMGLESICIAQSSLHVGIAAVDITPPIGYRHGGGYGEVISTGVRDPLYAKAMVYKQGSVSFCIVECDLLSVPITVSQRVRDVASKETGISGDAIVVAGTHNHGSPEYWGPLRDIFHEDALGSFGNDPHETVDYVDMLETKCVEAICKAVKEAKPCAAELLNCQVEGLPFNRRFHMKDGSVRFNPGRLNQDIVRAAGPIDIDFPVVLFRTEPGSDPFGAFCSLAMHTAVAGDTEFGADFPGLLQKQLRMRFGDSFHLLYAQGAAGDINHVNVRAASTLSSIEESQRVASELEAAIVRQLPYSVPIAGTSLQAGSRIVRVGIIPVSEEQYRSARQLLREQRINKAPFLKLVEAWRDCHRWDETQRHGANKPWLVQGLRLNKDTAIVTLPHEVFVEVGLTIKSSSPFRHTIVVSLANEVDYYIPTRRAFEEGSYEISTCPLEPGCGELLARNAIELLESLKN
jgi:neutral ceramidase